MRKHNGTTRPRAELLRAFHAAEARRVRVAPQPDVTALVLAAAGVSFLVAICLALVSK